MLFPLRKLLLVLLLAVTTLVLTNSLLRPADDCECCTEVQMMCAACKTCASPALISVATPLWRIAAAPLVETVPKLNPSLHTEDIWHPPKALV